MADAPRLGLNYPRENRLASHLQIMADLGLAKDALAALLQMLDYHADHVRFMAGPIVVHQSPWMADIPTWMFQKVPPDRMRVIIAEHQRGEHDGVVGPVELATIMFPATMEAPLPSDLTDLYLWAAGHACSVYYGKPPEHYWETAFGDTRPAVDADVLDPHGRLHYPYRELAGEARRKVLRAQREREREGKRAAKLAAKKAREGTPDVMSAQLPLFGEPQRAPPAPPGGKGGQ